MTSVPYAFKDTYLTGRESKSYPFREALHAQRPLLLPNPVTLFLPSLHLGALILSLLATHPCLLYNQKLSSPSHPQPSCLLWVVAPVSPLKEAYSFLF